MSFSYDVCIVGLKCYDVLTRAKEPRYLGGIEKQLVSLARGLVDEGQRVAFITYDHGQVDRLNCNGITVFKSFTPDAGIPGIRFIHPRMTLLWAAMHRADAPIYLQMGAGNETGQVAMGCCFGKKFIFLVASDTNCECSLSNLRSRRERFLYRYGLRDAALVISQTEKQRILLLKSFQRESVVLSLPCTWGISDNNFKAPIPPKNNKARIMWVGRIIESKRLEWFIDLAEKCPEMFFDVVGTPNSESVYYTNLLQRAKGTQNLTMHGKVSSVKLQRLYQEAALLCCTSEIEGFPTTFLEAWNNGLPVLTTFDPDDIIKKNGIGCVVDTQADLEKMLIHLIKSPAQWEKLSKLSRKYFCDNYTARAILPDYIQHFERLLNQ